jgi:ParB-like chromosome segregation protein Spo0J
MTNETIQLTFDGMAPSHDASATIVHVTLGPTPLPFHPLADLFPLLEGAEFDELVEDIRQHGVLEPVWLYDDQVLDGRNRYRACQALDIHCPSRIYDGNDPVGFVLALNIKRRHLTESQRAMVAAEIAHLAPHRPAKTVGISTVTQSEAAKMLHVSRESVVAANNVRKEGAPEVIDAVKTGELRVSSALELTGLPKEDQVAVLEDARQEAEGKPLTATRLRAAVDQHVLPPLPRMDDGSELTLEEIRSETTSVLRKLQGYTNAVPVSVNPPGPAAPHQPKGYDMWVQTLATLERLGTEIDVTMPTFDENERSMLEQMIAVGLVTLEHAVALLRPPSPPTPTVTVPHPKPVSSRKSRTKAKKRSVYGAKTHAILKAARTFHRFKPVDVTAIARTQSGETSNVLRLAVKRQTVIDGQRLVVDPVTDEYVWVVPEASDE